MSTREERGCEKCPVDPCRLVQKECGAFWATVRIFEEITTQRYAQEYARSSNGSAKIE